MKPKLLQAAAELISEQGGDQLTLDKVAERADVSKGGLLYHFPSKDALMMGLLQHLVEAIEQEEAAVYAEFDDSKPHNAALLMVLARLRAARSFRDQKHFNHALLTAAVNHRHLVDQIRGKLLSKLEVIAKDPRALQIFLAVEGLFFLETLKLTDGPDWARFTESDPLEDLIQHTLDLMQQEADQ